MGQTIAVRVAEAAGYLGLRFFAGEALIFEIEDRPEAARVTVTLGLDPAAAPLVQRGGEDRVVLSAQDLAPLPEGCAGLYNVWLETAAGRRLLQHGSIVARPSLAPEAPMSAPVASALPDVTSLAGEALSQDLAAGFAGGDMSFALAPGSDPLPPGLTLSDTGLLTGRAEAAVRAVLTVRARNAGGHADLSFTLQIEASRSLAAAKAGPRLLVDGDSTMANPGFRDALLWALGDVSFLPDAYQQATGGHTVQDMLDTAQAVVEMIVPNETIVVLGPVGANWDNGVTDEASGPTLAQLYDTYLDAGAVVVSVPTLPDGHDAGAPPDLSRQSKFDILRAVTALYAATRENFHAVDVSGFDPVTMKNDRTHPNIEHGAVYLASQLREVVRPLITGNRMHLEPNLLGTAGGLSGDAATTAPNVTGVQPSGWIYTTLGSGQWTAARDGNGDLTISCTAPPDQSQITLRCNPTVDAVAGDIFDALIELAVDPGSTGFGGIMTGVAGSTMLGLNSVTAFETLPDWPIFARSRGYVQEGANAVRQVALGLSCTAGKSVSYTIKRASMFLVSSASNVLTITGTPPATVAEGEAYGFAPVVAGGTPPHGFDLASGILPPGLSLDPATGAIGGTATTTGRYAGIALRVTDAAGATAVMTPFAIEVTAAGVPVNTVPPSLDNTSPAEGDTLTVDPGSWSPPEEALRFEWRVSGNIQEGETAARYTVPTGTAPQTITCRVWAANASGEGAAAETPPTEPVRAVAAPVAAWNTTVPDWTEFGGVQDLTYDDQGRTVSAQPSIGGLRNAVGAQALTGKRYFEVEMVSGVNFVGVADEGMTIATGSLSSDRHGKAGAIIYHSDGTTAVGNILASGQRVCVAIDTQAALFWMRQDDGAWNEDPGADPATGAGGFGLAGLTAPIHACVQLKKESTAQARLHGTAGRVLYQRPTGFAPIA